MERTPEWNGDEDYYPTLVLMIGLPFTVLSTVGGVTLAYGTRNCCNFFNRDRNQETFRQRLETDAEEEHIIEMRANS